MLQQSMPSMVESEHQVPRLKRFLWGLGGFTDATIIYGLFGLVSAIYINALGVNAVLISLACAIPRFLDSVSDPLIGHLSDNTRSRWGRRRPWLAVGILLSALFGVLLWFAPLSNPIVRAYSNNVPKATIAETADATQTLNVAPDQIANPSERIPWWKSTKNAIAIEWKTFLYLSMVMTLLMAIGYTLFNVPHYAMGYEMTTNYDERTHLFKWRFVSFAAAGFMTPWLMPLCMWFEGDQAQTLRGSQGVIYVSIIVGIVILITGMPSLFCKERIVVTKQKAKILLADAFRLTLHNKPFLLLLGSNFIARFGMAVTGIFFYYVFIYHIGKGEQLKGVALLAIFFNAINIANFLAMAPIASLSSRIGKKQTLLLMLAMSAVAYASVLFTFSNSDEAFFSHTFHVGAASWTLSMQWPTILTAVLIGVFTNTMPMITNSMIADICDYDELQCGERREGFYGAVYTSVEKISLSVSLFFQGVLLIASGFDAALTIQSSATIRYWILALVVTQPIGFLIGIILILFYPLTRARAEEIRRELESSRNFADATISG